MQTTIAFATCKDLPHLTDDDKLAAAVLETRGIRVEPAVWNDPAVDWSAYAAVVLRSMWDYHLHVPDFLAWLDRLDKTGAIVWNSTETVRWNADKNYLHDLQQKGVNVIPSVWLPQGSDASFAELIEKQGWEKAVVKPIISATAHETALVSRSGAQDFQSQFIELVFRTGVVVQEFAPEVQAEGEWSLIFYDKNYSHSILKRPKVGDFRVQTEWGGVELEAEAPRHLIEQARRIVGQVDARLLYGRVDGIQRDGELCLMELELIEPHLYFGFHPQAPERFADVLSELIAVTQ